MSKVIRSVIGLVALAAFAVLPSMATASPELVNLLGMKVPVGTNFQATNVAHAATSAIVKITLPDGKVIECQTGFMTGKIIKNSGTHIEGEITAAEFSGTPGVTPHTGHCKSPLGNVTVTPNLATNPAHEGHPSLPWCITAANNKDQFEIKGGKCGGMALPLTVAIHSPASGLCSYSTASVTGTYTTDPAAAIGTIINQEFTKITGGVFCPPNGKLDMAFTLEEDVASPFDFYIR